MLEARVDRLADARQIETGSLVMGNLKIALKPDVFTDGKTSIADHQATHGWFADTYDYARNPLAIMVANGNPKGIHGLADLGRDDVAARVHRDGEALVQGRKTIHLEQLGLRY